MATFDPIPYTYIPTALRFKSTKAPYNRTPKQVSVLDKIQRIKASSAALGTPRPLAAVAAANESRNDGPGIRNNPIVLLGDDESNASDSEVFDSNLRAESAGPDAGSSSSPETAVNSRPLAPPSSLDGWYDIDDYPKTVQRLRLAEGALTSNSMCPYNPSSRLSSELLHDRIDTGGLNTHRARSETATSHSARPRGLPPRRSRESTGNRLGQEDRLHAGQSTADEREYEDQLVRPALNTDTFDKGERQQQEAEAKGEVDKDDDKDDGQPQQRVNSVAVLTTERVGDTHLFSKGDESARPAKRQRPLPYSDSSPEPSHDEAGSHSDSYSDDELNNAKSKSDKDDERPRPAKRKRPSSSYDGPTQWKRKNYLQYRSSRQRKPRSKSHQHYPKSHSLLDQGSRAAAGSSAEGQLLSPAPSAPQATDTDVSPDCCNPSPRDVLPTLTEVTFRPHSLYCCSSTAVIRDGCGGRGVSFGQLAQLIESIGHVGKIDDFTIKPIEHHSFLLTGFGRYTSSQPSFGGATLSTAKAGCNHVDVTRTRPQNGRAVDARALASRRSEPPSSDDDGGLSDSDPESSSNSSTSKHSRWSDLDEQRLIAYKKEGKSWDWIFGKLPGRTGPAIRTRWNMVRPRDK
ncbi:MAG: hypothetical protein M1839_003026 [Geoglossum umbratile]|nr:MAG: hypothetical protein M1839_003026 [Geoglossum umbratile]